MADKSLMDEIKQTRLAIELIQLGARVQVLQAETDLSRGRLIKLYKEIHGVSPPKGMLPFSCDWYLTWLPNIHSSLFYNGYDYLRNREELGRMDAIAKAYRLYLEQVPLPDAGKPVLGLTRAWTLVRYFENGMMQLSTCTRCEGRFVNHAYSLDQDFVCGICRPPSRAGKTRKNIKARKPATQRREESQELS